MEYMDIIFSIMFFLGALVSLYWGLYIIKLNSKQRVNKAFFFLCLALSIWSLGFGMANSSTSLDTALFWRRFASIGMVSIFSIILHFLLLITRQVEETELDNTIYLIHIPAIICLYIFTISSEMARIQYDLVKIDYGLTNIASNSIWNYFYYFYYSLYMILALILVWNWRERLKDKTKVRQANFIFGSILAASILGSLTDIVSTSFMLKPLPQVAPLFILLPVWAMYYSARHYDLIGYKKLFKNELIVTIREKEKIFYSIAVVFIASGVFSFLFEYSLFIGGDGNLTKGVLKSIMFFITGIIIYFLQKIKNDRLKDKITIFILVVNIPIITINFIKYSSITVWAFPIIIMIVSLVFSKKTLLVSTAVVSIATQCLIWFLKPRVRVLVDEYDYILRIFLLLAAFIVGYYVNKIYLGKLEENDFQIKFQKMNARISSDFININKENMDEKIDMLLGEIGLFFGADRSYLFLIDYEDNTMSYSHEWCNKGIKSELRTIEKIPLTYFAWWVDQLNKNKLVLIEDIDDIPQDAISEKEQLIKQDIKTLVSVAVKGQKEIKGFIGVDFVRIHRKWTDQDIKLLNILSNLLSDSLERIKSESEIEYMAYYDRLTKLPNRFLFKERVTRAIKLAKRTEDFISIIFIDLDNFKSVNDTLGHDGGDYLLKEVAKKLNNSVRETDTVARFGGDEFMIMVTSVKNKNDITKVAENVMKVFSKAFSINGEEFFIKASAGISSYPIDGEDPEALIKNADIAMYEAKSKGKNCFEFCTTNLKDEVEKNMTMSNDLYYALEKGQLSLHYQPQIDLNNKEIVGLEALLRWKHPQLGMIPPKIFIPIAEKNGLIHSIGEWVLKTACLQNKKWQDMGLPKIKIAVNLSGIQFINANIAGDVSRILKKTGLNPKYLELEITESIAIKETEFVVDVLNKLKKVGVSIAIDDFGTEYSSLSRLRKLPIDRIKIDMEFIHGIENNDKDKAVTAIIINLAKSLGLNVIAEGVETAPQLEFLNQKMCDYVQGFYYYKPMPAEEMEKILKSAECLDKYLLEQGLKPLENI